MKKTILILACASISCSAVAQDMPKWVGKARKAVFSVITYDKNNQILNTGNGFYIDSDGTAVSDYTLFKGAQRAVIVTADGKEMPVKYILGANDLYDVVKFKTDFDKKAESLTLANGPADSGSGIYLLPYSTQKSPQIQQGKIEKVDSISNNSFYYTLDMKTSDITVSCPIMNTRGEVLAMVQRNTGGADSRTSYAVGVTYAQSLSINALSANDPTLNAIGIKKGLPNDESQALVYLYMASSTMKPEDYQNLLNDFVLQFPESLEGYFRRASFLIGLGDNTHLNLAAQDMQTMTDIAKKKDEAHYNIAKLIYNYQLNRGEKPVYADWTFERALKETDTAIQDSPQPVYQQLKGDICFAMHKYADAFQAYSAVNHSPMASAASFYAAAKAKELTDGADRKEVIALMDSAVAKFNPPYGQDAAPYIYERAQAKEGGNDFKGAVADYSAFYDAMMGQVSAEFYFTRMQAEMKCRMYQQALDDINKATADDPGNVDYWVEKGGVHLRVNQPDEAVKALKKAISIDPKNAPAYRMLGYTQIQLKNSKEGLSNLQKAFDLGDEVAGNLLKKYNQ